MALRSRLAIDRITILGETASTQANVLPAQVCSDAANRRLRLSSVPVAQNPKVVLDGRWLREAPCEGRSFKVRAVQISERIKRVAQPVDALLHPPAQAICIKAQKLEQRAVVFGL